MRSPLTAKDDQPGPIGRRHSSFGGEADQSVLMCTAAAIPSRWGPRNPGQSRAAFATMAAGVAAGAGRGATAGFSPPLGVAPAGAGVGDSGARPGGAAVGGSGAGVAGGAGGVTGSSGP